MKFKKENLHSITIDGIYYEADEIGIFEIPDNCNQSYMIAHGLDPFVEPDDKQKSKTLTLNKKVKQ